MHSNIITPSKEKRCPKYREIGQDDRGLLVRKKSKEKPAVILKGRRFKCSNMWPYGNLTPSNHNRIYILKLSLKQWNKDVWLKEAYDPSAPSPPRGGVSHHLALLLVASNILWFLKAQFQCLPLSSHGYLSPYVFSCGVPCFCLFY